MISLVILCYFAGALTILSPCILPVLPFVFASAQKSFVRGSLPLLLGMSLTFSLFSALALVGGEWVVQANQYGRYLALAFLSLFALSLLWPELSAKIFAPAVALGSKWSTPHHGGESRFTSSFGMGMSTGLLWAPCAGPILGLVLTGAAAQKNLATSIFLLLSYSLGASSSLGLALVSGQRFLRPMKKALGVDQVIKKILGLLVLAGVLIILLGWDKKILEPLSKIETAGLETKLLAVFQQTPKAPPLASVQRPAPELVSGLPWLNSQALTMSELKGKVVLIDFWTYSCINCLRTLPYVKAWSEKYKDQGLVVIGVHTPEFGFEKIQANVQKAVQDLGIQYPVVLDNDYQIWNSYKNQYWPAHYFIDRDGHLRFQHFGEGHYEESEAWIQGLLKNEQPTMTDTPKASRGPEITSETYLGLGKTQTLVTNPKPREDKPVNYQPAGSIGLNHWSVQGPWTLSDTEIHSGGAASKLLIHFKAREVNLVMGSRDPVKYQVWLDGKPLQEHQGQDSDVHGQGQVRDHRLYNLFLLSPGAQAEEHTLEIQFLGPHVDAFSWTFG